MNANSNNHKLFYLTPPMCIRRGARQWEIHPYTTGVGVRFLGFENGMLVSRGEDSAAVLAGLIRGAGVLPANQPGGEYNLELAGATVSR